MQQVLARFVIGGTLVALLPAVAQQLGPATAGLGLLFPAVSLGGLLFIGQAEGLGAVAKAALAGVVGLPTVLAFLLAVYICARRQVALPLALAIGILCWLAVAVPIDFWNRRRDK